MNSQSFPKIELHRHLEGALRLGTIIELAAQHGRELPARTAKELAPYAQVLQPMDSLQAVLDAFDLFQHTFLTEDAVERIAYEAVEDAANDGIKIVEVGSTFECEAADRSGDTRPVVVTAGGPDENDQWEVIE